MRKLDLRPERPKPGSRRGLLLRLALLAGLLAVALTAVVAPALAFTACSTCTPWWHLNLESRPTILQGGLAKDEVQQLTVGATEEFEVRRLLIDERPFTEKGPVAVKAGATAHELQEHLEEPEFYGSGNVAVTGGPEEGKPYLITFTGAFADQAVLPLKVSHGSVVEVTHGRPDGEVVVTAENLGDAPVNGTTAPVQISEVLPPGLREVAISGNKPAPEAVNERRPLPCSFATLSCEMTEALAPYEQLEVRVAVVVEPSFLSGAANEAHVSGGGAPSSSVSAPVTLGGATPFGVETYELSHEEPGGSLATQAGVHPFQQTTTINLNQGVSTNQLNERSNVEAVGLAKDLNIRWPAGLIGNPQAVERCSLGAFVAAQNGKLEDRCPPQTAVGVASVTVREPASVKRVQLTVPLFNVEPAPGEPARFGFFVSAAAVPVVIDTALRTGSDYGVTVSSHDISQTASFLSAEVTVWGVPGDPRHDLQRGWGCLLEAHGIPESTPESKRAPCNPANEAHPPPFLSMPTSCTGPLTTEIESASWAAQEVFGTLRAPPLPALVGCNQLPFASSINVTPDGQAASTPTGLNVDVHVPQTAILNGAGLASSDVKDITVAFPEGVVLNPAAADGLQACSEAQIGFTDFAELNPNSQPGVQTAQFTPRAPSCPESSKVGNVAIKTPLLPNKLEGALYLASQNANPFGSLVATYLVAEDPISGSLVKLPGEVTLDQTTGQITATFKNSPQVAFEDAEIHLYGGDRAPFATPAHCGTYTTNASFTPWSGNAPVSSSSSFNITSGPNGSPCPAMLPFAPTLTAGTTNINAGSFSPLTTTISRADGNQDIQTVQLHMPPGLSGILKGVPLCPEAQANAGTCSQESLIGKTIVSVGLGGDPFSVTGGKVYLTEKYAGAPFGLSIVNPAVAGPFDLGKVIVRAKIEVDPTTAELTITTGRIPHILDGIPLQIKHVNVTIDRLGFTFNPTNCGSMAVTGTIGSVEAASSPVSVPFKVHDCASLKFAPKFSVSTSGRTSRASGASLTAKLSYPRASFGTQAEISRVKVDLPKQLPSRLTTLQKACTNAQFVLNPANCPAASKIGMATVMTPLLPVPLTGPAIFVSHGGEAFPSLTVVLQGYGVTIDLVGTTFISKAGITSTTFKAVPDVPFDTFALKLPQGKFSALAANGNLCRSKLAMPTAFVAQNGLVIHRSTKIAVTGCAKHKAKRIAGHSKKHRRR